MFHVPAHKVPAGQPQPGQSYFDPRLALVRICDPVYIPSARFDARQAA